MCKNKFKIDISGHVDYICKVGLFWFACDGRDLGEYIRERVKLGFSAGVVTKANDAECERIHASLKRLADNHHSQLYKRVLSSSASGLSVKVSESQDLPYEILHVPVMVKEVLRSLQPCPGQVFIDMTFGAGGHSRKLLQSTPNIKLFVLDRDPFAHSLAYKLANEFPGQVTPLLGKFSELPQLLSAQGVRQNSIDGIMFDFGCSSMQFDIAERGFSISKDGPLDMRMDGNRFPNAPTAADILAHADEDDIARILRIYGEEKQSKKIARAIIEARYLFKRLETTHELKELVASVCETDQRTDKLQRPTHSATKTFQALRIFVNNEVNELNYGMLVSLAYLKTEGKLVTLTFHSLEDRIVKRHLSGNIIDNAINPLPLRYMSQALWHDREAVDKLLESNWESIYKHVLIPTMEEVDRNPRSRSAKLRAAIRVKKGMVRKAGLPGRESTVALAVPALA
uniref:Uncharacterized protein n=1 Tax=Timema monikensis TaxID=170555 RepID=A0A7R9HRZ3_9NEOP|nr:unnamed protein product [Timema monikensis]